MKTIVMMRGLPGSGKSTYVRELQKESPNIVRVNKDSLRDMLHNGVHSKGREKFIVGLRNWIIQNAFAITETVIVDDTNFNPVHEQTLREIAQYNNADFQIMDMKHEDETDDDYLKRCFANDLKRQNSVGEKVIRQMFNQYCKTTPPKVEKDPSLPNCVICDLDGTLCLFADKNPYDRDFENDEPNPAVLEHLQLIGACNSDGRTFSTDIIFFSGRNDKHRDVTRKWLDDHGFGIYKLYMRKNGDTRKDFIVKSEMFDEVIRGKFNVKYVLDDRLQVVQLWRSMGLTCFQVNDGDF